MRLRWVRASRHGAGDHASSFARVRWLRQGEAQSPARPLEPPQETSRQALWRVGAALARFDGGAVAAAVADQFQSEMCFDQSLMHALGLQLRCQPFNFPALAKDEFFLYHKRHQPKLDEPEPKNG